MADHYDLKNIKAIGKITPELKNVLNETKSKLKGPERRKFMAQIVSVMGPGGQSRAERELGWNKHTMIKGRKELESGISCIDNFSGRGRKCVEDHLPNILNDIKDLVNPGSQADPTFRTTKLYTPITAKEVHKRLIEEKHYSEDQLPTIRTIRTKLNQLNFHPQKVSKSKPKKK